MRQHLLRLARTPPSAAEGLSRPGTPSSPQQPGLAQLTIGYHQLEGKQVALKKPLAIMEKGVDASCGGCCGYKVSPHSQLR